MEGICLAIYLSMKYILFNTPKRLNTEKDEVILRDTC